MYNRFLLTIISLFLFVNLLTAGTFKGKVLDKETNTGLNHVKIEVLDTRWSAFTNRKGEFNLPELKEGEYTVLIIADGYIPIEKRMFFNQGGVIDSTFRMEADPLLTHEIVVTGTRTNHTVGDTPVAAEVVTKQEIKQQNVKEIQDAFSTMSGVRMRKTSGSWGNKGNIELQGMDANHTLILVDGQRYTGGHGGVDLASIPLDMVQKIEVVKGPSSVLYGSDAMGGVVNVITKSAVDKKPSFNLSSTVGSYKTSIIEAGGNYSKHGFGVSMNVTKKDSNGVNKDTDQISETAVSGNLSYRFSPELSLSLSPRYEYTKLDKQDRMQKRFAINSLLSWRNNKGSVLKVRGSLFNYKHYTTTKSSDWDDTTYEAEVIGTHAFNKNNVVTAGYHMQHEKIEDRGKGYEADQTMHSFFAQDEITLNPVTLVLGARIDSHNEWGTQFNPKATAMFKVSDSFKIRASAGKSFRGPKLVKLYGSWNMGSFIVKPNADLKPEESTGYQAGIEWKMNQKVFFNASLFHNDIDNLISSRFDRSSRPWVLSWINVAEARTQGLDFSIKTVITSDFTAKAGATFLKTKDKLTDEKLLNKPDNSAFLSLNYKFRSIGLNVNVTGNYTGKRTIEKKVGRSYVRTDLDSFATVDLSVSKKISSMGRIFLKVTNLLDKKDVYDEYNIDGARIFAGFELNLQ